MKRLGGVTPVSAHILDLGHVDIDSQLSGLEDAQEGDDGSNNFHIGMFSILINDYVINILPYKLLSFFLTS